MIRDTSLKVLLAGKNEIAVFGLRALLARLDKKNISVICNSTDEGYDTWQPSLKKLATEHEVTIVSLDECYEIENLVFISLEFDKIISPEKFATIHLYNIHFSALPAYKGMYTSALPLLNGDTESGVTLHKIDKGIDTGDIIDQIIFKIDKDENARDLYGKYLFHAKDLLESNVDRILKGDVKASQQSSKGSSYFSKKAIDYQNLEISLSATAQQISNQIRAYTFPEYQVPRIHNYCVNSSIITSERSTLRAGVLISMSPSNFRIATVDYDLIANRDKTAELFKAARNNDLKLANECLDNGACVDAQNGIGWTPLIVAAFNGSSDVIGALIECGADINLTNYKGTTPIMYAMSFYEETGNKVIFELLRSRGARLALDDINGKSIRDYAIERNVNGLS